MKRELKLSPYSDKRWLNLCIDAASSKGIGYVLYQNVDDDDPSLGSNIIQAGSSLLPNNLGFSPVDSELAALSFACKQTDYFLINCQKLRLLSDCSGLCQMLSKDLTKIKNPKHHRILTSIQHIIFKEVQHISGSNNQLADALSRLTTTLRLEGEEMVQDKPRILGLSSCRARLIKQLDTEDPLVQNLAAIASLDEEMIEMMRYIENGTPAKQIPETCELKRAEGALADMRVVTMNSGDRLIAKDRAVYIPTSEREHLVNTLHLTHASAVSMLLNAKDRVWWPGLRAALHKKYAECKECSMFRISQTRPSNECSFKDLFMNYYPNTILQTDFCEYQGQNFMVIVDIQSGYGRVFKTPNKTTSSVVTTVRQWINMYGRPTQIRCDAGPSYREGFISDMKKLGISVSHSSAYSPMSNSHAERYVRTLKTLLRKCGPGIS